jgi:outer membrane protein insertion porin family
MKLWYKERDMKRKILALFFFLFSCSSFFLYGEDTVEKIEIIGNERVSTETVLYYLSSKEGDFFNEELFKKDFRVLWATGFFANIKIEKADGTTGKIVRIIVEENPVVKTITYKTGRRLKENDIVSKLKEEDRYVMAYSYYSPHKVKEIKKVIEDLLLEKGLMSGTVEAKTNQIGKNEVEILFEIKEGPRMKIGEVVFEGKPKLLPSILRGAMKENKRQNVFWWIAGKDVFKKNKLPEDLENIKKKLQQQGYMEATIGEPRIEEITKRNIFLKKRKMMKIIIPVNAGYRYRVGEIKIEGNKIVSTEGLRRYIKFKEGDIYSTKIREKSIEEIGEIYRNVGYLRAQIIPVESLDPKRKRVNVTFNIYEGEVAYLNRLEFKGNTYTKDKVIRREMLLREGDRFSIALFKDSILRMQQLGLVEIEGEPDVRPNPENPNLMDVTLNVREMQRNNIQFTAGYSGYEGTFIALSYSTVNFLGAGEKLELMLQTGKYIKNYMFGFTEPYFLDLPMNLGFKIFDRSMEYQYLFTRKGKGIDFHIGGRIKGYVRTDLTYSYELIDIKYLSGTGGNYGSSLGPYSYGRGEGEYRVSSITPSIYRSTVNSPIIPTAGSLYLATCKFAGGFLGGGVNMIKPRFEWKHFKPIIGNHVLGLHAEYQFIKSFGESRGIPIWERFFLGGERSIRGYNYYAIGPRQKDPETGQLGSNIGGEKSLVLNAEYIVPFGSSLFFVLFYDYGNAFARDEKINFNNMHTSTGIELRIFVPALRIPFRLIFAYNSPKEFRSESSFNFRFATGTTF